MGALMGSFEMTVEVDRHPGEVFAFISDLSNDPTWRREWHEAKSITVGPVRVGPFLRSVRQGPREEDRGRVRSHRV
jgi:hypothetical protein